MSKFGTKREEIVDRHMKLLLDELKATGVDTIGVAGGIVIAAPSGNPSDCHVFFLVEAKVVTQDGRPINTDAFLADVAGTMLRSSKSKS